MQRIFDVVRVSVWVARRAVETAEFAVDVTDIRGIKMSIDVESSHASVFLPPHSVGEFPEGIQICGVE